MHSSTDRLAALERQLRNTRRWTALSLVAALVFIGVAAVQKPADNLQVKQLTAESISTGNFTLRDAKGRPRVSILMGKDGGPAVALLDESSKVRMLLSLHENQHPLVQLSNAQEEPQLNLLYNKNLGSGLVLLGTAGRAMFVVPSGAAPMLEFNDAQGAKVFTAP